mgnify:CR=1 FL=1
MKIEFLLVNNIGEQCSQMTAFNVPAHMSKDLQNRGFFQGICIIDTVTVKWCFSGLGHDGDIYTTNEVHRSIIHAMLPLFIYNLSHKDWYKKGWTRQDHDDLVEEQERLRDEGEQYEQEEKQRLELGWDCTEAELKEEQEENKDRVRGQAYEAYEDDNSPELDDRGPLFINNPKD